MEIRKIYSEFNTPVYLSKALNLYYGGWEICCPMHTFGPAIRQHYLVHYVTRGKGRLWMNDTCYVIEKDTMFLIRPGITCVYQADKDDPWEYCWICIDGYDVENMLNNSGFDKVNLLFFDKSNGEVRDAMLNFIFYFSKYKNNEYMLLSRLYNIFGHMKIQMKKQQAKSIHVERAIDYIYENYSKNISVTDIAEYLGIDRTYLYRLFKEEYNMSPQKYLLNFRLKTAMNKLEGGNMSIADIAYSCGFNDASAFCHQFKKVYKDTPLNYRRYPQLAIRE
ncbi:AraC family transcriptional regulator [Megamonas funiformis]|jgi:AraC-like DNA-binding protein|uniref:AraC family transcriptional regulator n=1 Tax=Megamonas funiformis TaxID=437897 RepID=UPI0022E94233|nr:AraC family transcriptional regulator [Megamonas funiformis]